MSLPKLGHMLRYLFFVFLLTIPVRAYAYIGPGLGVGTIGVVLGVLASVLLAFFAILWYPIKRLIRRIKRPHAIDKNDDSSSS